MRIEIELIQQLRQAFVIFLFCENNHVVMIELANVSATQGTSRKEDHEDAHCITTPLLLQKSLTELAVVGSGGVATVSPVIEGVGDVEDGVGLNMAAAAVGALATPTSTKAILSSRQSKRVKAGLLLLKCTALAFVTLIIFLQSLHFLNGLVAALPTPSSCEEVSSHHES